MNIALKRLKSKILEDIKYYLPLAERKSNNFVQIKGKQFAKEKLKLLWQEIKAKKE